MVQHKHVVCKYGDAIPRIEEKLDQIHTTLTGNGAEGLIKEVGKNTKVRYIVIGVGCTLSTAGFIYLLKMVV